LRLIAGLIVLGLWLAPVLSSCKGCWKEYHFSGTVRSADGTPRNGVTVSFSRGPHTEQATTDSDGVYAFSFKTVGDISGTSLKVELNGAELAVSDPLTQDEVRPDDCGDRDVVRDIRVR
jgi:hypothetical protein